MRVFWAIMAVLGIAAGAAWFLRSPKVESSAGAGSVSLTYSEQLAGDEPAKRVKTAAAVLDAEAARGRPDPSAIVETPKAALPVVDAPKPEPVKADPPKMDAPKPVKTTKPDATTDATDSYVDPVADEGDGVAQAVKAATTAKPAPAAATPVVAKPEAKTDAPNAAAPKPDAPKADAPKADAPKPDAPKIEATAGLKVKLEPQDDGSTLVDGKYVIKGAGTKEDPYRVTWEMLISVEETYRPRLGKKVIPDRVKMLDGKWIRISGYIAFPVMASSGDEMLMMLNQWDGCCIGVPPTPYDAIEVKLKAAAKGNDRLRTTGTLTGKFKVDPYLVKDWLISLYVMDDGDLSNTAGTATPGMHQP